MHMPQWVAHVLVLLGGLAVLTAGGEMLVRGAARLAGTLGVSVLVVGLTVVAFGTSAPEAAVTIFAARQGAAGLALGNVVGSNIANVLLILGLAAAVRPIPVARSLIRLDGPVMVASAAALYGLMFWQGGIGRLAGAAFVVGLVAYTGLAYYLGRRNPPPTVGEALTATGRGRLWWYNALLVLVGIGGLIVGARLIVSGSTGLALLLGISEHVVGLTIVAVGTSLPELATTVIAARRNQPDIAIGNVVGSNTFNVLFVTGAAALASPLHVPVEITRFDAPLMLAVCALFVPLAWTGRRVTRGEGVVLLALYVLYVGWTVAHAH